jgi:hypothetical protein
MVALLPRGEEKEFARANGDAFAAAIALLSIHNHSRCFFVDRQRFNWTGFNARIVVALGAEMGDLKP